MKKCEGWIVNEIKPEIEVSKTALSTEIVRKFCELCNWAHESWQMFRIFFDKNPKVELFEYDTFHLYFQYLALSTKEHSLLQIAKLHDPAIQGKNINLSIDYIISNGDWRPEVTMKLEQLRKQLDEFATLIKPVRDKLYSHFDLDTILKGEPIGGFPPGKDEEYFENLQEFANIVHQETIGGIFPFTTNSFSDAEVVLRIITEWTENNKKLSGI